jgi:hypothetical protein
VAAIHERLHEEGAPPLGGRDQALGARDVERERLLA